MAMATKKASTKTTAAKKAASKKAPAKARVSGGFDGVWLFDRFTYPGAKRSVPLSNATALVVAGDTVEEHRFGVDGAAFVNPWRARIDGDRLTLVGTHRPRSYVLVDGALQWVDTSEELDTPQTVWGRRIDRATLDRHGASILGAARRKGQRAQASFGEGTPTTETPAWVASPTLADLMGPATFIASGASFGILSARATPYAHGWNIELRSKANVKPLGDHWVGTDLRVLQLERPRGGEVVIRNAADLDPTLRKPRNKRPLLHVVTHVPHPTPTTSPVFAITCSPVDHTAAIVRIEAVDLRVPATFKGAGGTLRISVFVNGRRTIAPTGQLVLRATLDVPIEFAGDPGWRSERTP